MPANAKKVYDYLVVGAGSGGIASARRAASYGAKVAIVEAGGSDCHTFLAQVLELNLNLGIDLFHHKAASEAPA